MKICSMFLILLLFATLAIAQTYQVAYIQDEIRNLSDGTVLKKSNKYSREDKLHCPAKNCRMIVNDSYGGAHLVILETTDRHYNVKYLELEEKVGVRPGMIHNAMLLLQYLGKDERLLVMGDQTAVSLTPAYFSLSDEQYFYIRYFRDTQIIDRKLPYFTNGFIIHRDSLFLRDDLPQSDSFELRCVHLDQQRIFKNPTLSDRDQQRRYIPFHMRFIEETFIYENVFFYWGYLVQQDIDPYDRQGRRLLYHYLEVIFEGQIPEMDLDRVVEKIAQEESKWIELGRCWYRAAIVP